MCDSSDGCLSPGYESAHSEVSHVTCSLRCHELPSRCTFISFRFPRAHTRLPRARLQRHTCVRGSLAANKSAHAPHWTLPDGSRSRHRGFAVRPVAACCLGPCEENEALLPQQAGAHFKQSVSAHPLKGSAHHSFTSMSSCSRSGSPPTAAPTGA